MSLFLVFTIIFTFAGPAYSTVIYPPGTAPAMQGPLYDENGNEYHYSPGHGGYMSNGSMLPSGHPLYDKKGGKGNVYYAGESSQQNYQRSSEVWTALGAFLGFMIINAIVNNILIILSSWNRKLFFVNTSKASSFHSRKS